MQWCLPTTVLLMAACRPSAIPVSSPFRTNPALAHKSLSDLAHLLNRKASRANLYLSVSLWDRAYVEAFLKQRAAIKHWSAQQLNESISSWTNRFLVNQTSFRVRLEALHRPLVIQGTDPLLDLSAWRWELWDSKGHHVTATKAATELKKVFQGGAQQYSFRADGTVHFTYGMDPHKTQWIELIAYPPGNEHSIRLPKWHVRP